MKGRRGKRWGEVTAQRKTWGKVGRKAGGTKKEEIWIREGR